MGTAGKELMSYTEDFHASNCPSAWQVSGNLGTTTGISGRNFRAWSRKLDLVGWWLKTYLESSNLPLTTFVRTWSASATQSGFGSMKLRLSARGTGGCGCFLWRTPNAAEPGIDPALLEPIPGGEMGGNNRHYNRETGRVAQFGLSQQVKLWRTPKADDANHGSASEAGIMRRLEKHQTIRLQDQVNHPCLFRTPDAGC